MRPGVVATNLHVIDAAAAGAAKLVGQRTAYTVEGTVAVDEGHDLALLRVTGLAGPPLNLGNDTPVLVGDTVFAVGNPQGLEGTVSQSVAMQIAGHKTANVYRRYRIVSTQDLKQALAKLT